jgi:hypothetical protein
VCIVSRVENVAGNCIQFPDIERISVEESGLSRESKTRTVPACPSKGPQLQSPVMYPDTLTVEDTCSFGDGAVTVIPHVDESTGFGIGAEMGGTIVGIFGLTAGDGLSLFPKSGDLFVLLKLPIAASAIKIPTKISIIRILFEPPPFDIEKMIIG